MASTNLTTKTQMADNGGGGKSSSDITKTNTKTTSGTLPLKPGIDTPLINTNTEEPIPDIDDPPSGGGGGGGYRSSGGGGSSGGAKYTAATLPTATRQDEYINSMIDANNTAARANLEKSYNQNVMALDQEAAKIPATYAQEANAAASRYAINRANQNEYLAGNGMNTGAGSQAQLAMNNVYQSNLNSINLAKANALKDVENKRALYKKEYEDAITAAIAQNDAQRAQALYNEAVRVDNSIVETAINQATENYRAFTANR